MIGFTKFLFTVLEKMGENLTSYGFKGIEETTTNHSFDGRLKDGLLGTGF
jgi:hypothetical protein